LSESDRGGQSIRPGADDDRVVAVVIPPYHIVLGILCGFLLSREFLIQKSEVWKSFLIDRKSQKDAIEPSLLSAYQQANGNGAGRGNPEFQTVSIQEQHRNHAAAPFNFSPC
jgi:hypothetical protein